jgi:hypothetical protein
MDSFKEYPIICIYAICLFDTSNADICITYFNSVWFSPERKKSDPQHSPPSSSKLENLSLALLSGHMDLERSSEVIALKNK